MSEIQTDQERLQAKLQSDLERIEANFEEICDSRRNWMEKASNLQSDIEQLNHLLVECKAVLKLYADYPIGMVMSVTLRDRARELLAGIK